MQYTTTNTIHHALCPHCYLLLHVDGPDAIHLLGLGPVDSVKLGLPSFARLAGLGFFPRFLITFNGVVHFGLRSRLELQSGANKVTTSPRQGVQEQTAAPPTKNGQGWGMYHILLFSIASNEGTCRPKALQLVRPLR